VRRSELGGIRVGLSELNGLILVVLSSELSEAEVDVGVGGDVLDLVSIKLGSELGEKLRSLLDAELSKEVGQVLDVLLSLSVGHDLGEAEGILLIELGLGKLEVISL